MVKKTLEAFLLKDILLEDLENAQEKKRRINFGKGKTTLCLFSLNESSKRN